MPSTQNAVNNHEYRSVPITALVAESATNPRKRFDAKSLEELAASFKDEGDSGPTSGTRTGREQVRGHCRSPSPQSGETRGTRALPVRVVKLTDAEAIEAQCVENLQREDIHPMEEALGFKSLLGLGQPVTPLLTLLRERERARPTFTVV